MLKNDERFWTITRKFNAATQSWGSSNGDFALLWQHTIDRWQIICGYLAAAKIGKPRGNVIEFGAGLGHLDDLLDTRVKSLLLLDHSDAYLKCRLKPLSRRTRFLRWNKPNFNNLRNNGEQFDWWMSIAVFYHIDTASAVTLLLESAKLLKLGGYMLVHGWNDMTRETLRANPNRLFDTYPQYSIHMDQISDAVSPELSEIFRTQDWPTIIFKKTSPSSAKERRRSKASKHNFLTQE
jgi:2-polyprenyl-3-methyl-5-hydroxy-6-metoxy-1,4-benzoquinol methylase